MRHNSPNQSLFTIFLLLPLATGALSALLSGNMSASYPAFIKPPFAPPGILFPFVWTILYVLMGIASYLIAQSDLPEKQIALCIYFLQLFFNFMWSILFFRFALYLPAFLWLLLLIGLIMVMIVLFYRIRPAAAFLLLPYLLWCIFAAVLNYAVYLLN